MIHPASKRNQDQEDTAMTIRHNILSAVALSGIIFASHAGVSHAGEANKTQTFKPLQALSINAGQKHGIGYFLSDAKTCNLVVTLADEPNQDDPQGFTVTRYEAAVPAGQNTRYASEGSTFEFGCQADAHAMTFKPLSTVASDQSE
jgi:hypothetical protein